MTLKMGNSSKLTMLGTRAKIRRQEMNDIKKRMEVTLELTLVTVSMEKVFCPSQEGADYIDIFVKYNLLDRMSNSYISVTKTTPEQALEILEKQSVGGIHKCGTSHILGYSEEKANQVGRHNFVLGYIDGLYTPE